MTTRTYNMDKWDDRTIEEGDRVEPGWHHARISDVIEDFETNKITLEYTILGGPSEGKKINDYLTDPDSPNLSASAQEMCMRKQLLRAKRLGLLPPEDQRTGDVSFDWMDALGKECFLKVHVRTYKKNDGSDGAMIEPTFDGIYPPEDDRVPEPARRHEPCGLDVLSEADQKRAADKAAAKEAKAADKEAAKAAGGGRTTRKRATAGAAASGGGSNSAAASQTDFGDI